MVKLISCLDRQFAELNRGHCGMMGTIAPELLYRRPAGGASLSPLRSCGEYVLRSAATVEQTFGGITTNLWDDPFEWTLPEALTTPQKVVDYLAEVENTRQRGFELFHDDEDLFKEVMAPAGKIELLPLLLDTLTRAAHHQGGAKATLELLNAISRGGF
jgi:hypothetical protein